MKTIIIATILLFTKIGWTQTKVSVNDGDWNDPTTWSPASVPFLNEDSVIVNHEVALIPDIEVQINHLIVSSNGIIEGAGAFVLHGSLEVEGEFNTDTLVIGDGDYFINNGLIEGIVFTTSNLSNENFGYIDVEENIYYSEGFLNATGAVMESGEIITISNADFENNGSIYTDDWINEGTVFGTGSFCVENCFQNFGNVNGTLDVCDANPGAGFPCDFNLGVIEPTVTLCTNGPCSGSAEILENASKIEISIYPNPSKDGRFNLSTDALIESWTVFDLSGRQLLEKTDVDLHHHDHHLEIPLFQNGEHLTYQKLDGGEFHDVDMSTVGNGQFLILFKTEEHSIIRRITISN